MVGSDASMMRQDAMWGCPVGGSVGGGHCIRLCQAVPPAPSQYWSMGRRWRWRRRRATDPAEVHLTQRLRPAAPASKLGQCLQH